MAYTHRMQANRLELKYLIDERCAIRMREYVRTFLEPDEYANPLKNNSYQIHSLYMDSPWLTLCYATMNGLKNRFKLRIRFYDDVPEHPVFFEIKRRVTDTILKERCAVHRSSVPHLLAGRWPERSDLLKYDTRNMGTLQRFCSLRDTVQARGMCFVSYEREAYVSPHDDSVRVTFDRTLQASPFHDSGVQNYLAVEPLPQFQQPRLNAVVLELKFTDRFPRWMYDLVQSFNLKRWTMAKYVNCAMAMRGEILENDPVG